MNAVIFVGPTLSRDDAGSILEATYLPPAAQGDVYRAARAKPVVIGLVDGLFERTRAVWHKEILWAMSHGVHVFGSASLGALRAVELAAFGMEGVGAVYSAFAAGNLEDDDEVAVAHEPAEQGFRATSIAMVDIRATVAAAVQAGVLGPRTAAALESLAKQTFYPHRVYPRIIRDGAGRGLPMAELAAFNSWLPTGAVSIKRKDAVTMLELIRSRIESGLEPKAVAYTLETSGTWESFRMEMEAAGV